MGKHTGPTSGQIPELAFINGLTLTSLTSVGQVAGLKFKGLWLDSHGPGAVSPTPVTVIGAVQLQGSVAGDEYVNIGSPISTWPSFTDIDSGGTIHKYTHFRLQISTAITAGVPRALLVGDWD
jgi:hypothetical protein